MPEASNPMMLPLITAVAPVTWIPQPGFPAMTFPVMVVVEPATCTAMLAPVVVPLVMSTLPAGFRMADAPVLSVPM